MAEIPLTLKVLYQADEEILGTSFYYLFDGSIDDVGLSQLLCKDLADNFLARAQQFRDILGNHCYVIAFEARAPVVEGTGPGFYQSIVSGAGSIDGTVMTDQVTMVLNVTGSTELGTPVRNGKLISGLMKEAVNCNVLEQDHVDDVNGSIATFLPATINLSSGLVTHVVRADRGGGVITYHPVEGIALSGVVGSYGTRRGDVTPRRGKIVTPP